MAKRKEPLRDGLENSTRPDIIRVTRSGSKALLTSFQGGHRSVRGKKWQFIIAGIEMNEVNVQMTGILVLFKLFLTLKSRVTTDRSINNIRPIKRNGQRIGHESLVVH
jgi:hypothetical protein